MPANLMSLPTELLLSILSILEKTPYIHAHKIDLLLINKRWFELALPTYYASLAIGSWPLTATDIACFPAPGTSLHAFIAKKVSHLTIRLEGPWGEYLRQQYRPDDAEGAFVQPADTEALETWIDFANAAIQAFASSDRLAGLTALDSLAVELSQQDEREFGPRWDYVHQATLVSLCRGIAALQVFKSERGLPLLAHLTLDVCGSYALRRGDAGETIECVCAALSPVLPTLHSARVRMRCLCQRLFACLNSPYSKSSRLETLIVKLNQPFFTQKWTPDQFLTKRCRAPSSGALPGSTAASAQRVSLDAENPEGEPKQVESHAHASDSVLSSSRLDDEHYNEGDDDDGDYIERHMGRLVKALLHAGLRASRNMPRLQKIYISFPRSIESPLLLVVNCRTGRTAVHPDSWRFAGSSDGDASSAFVVDQDSGFAFHDDGTTCWWEEEVDITDEFPRLRYPGISDEDDYGHDDDGNDEGDYDDGES
ncbi:hypothetical protein EJ05DRAFT_243529 [Pseudovirgaria hyperparasitica]|uniref:F-box domain-containing protein n=1 Tax=Pseudovirgaria hyperparasitica TaxID=470096 RepID=A0A6A6WFX5_9PEZI|nr:uncharacterized protein EJ05DRAFT_243529 [Pseudovirgaria hyperparasitica]KAF2760826.1 hypothetical protein EJ05DRAFT_243529 [Pseudovirgaria hyperparasitica]